MLSNAGLLEPDRLPLGPPLPPQADGVLIHRHQPSYVHVAGCGGRSFVFYHAGMADTLLRPDEINRELIAHAAIFHFGSVTLASALSAEATLSAARFARQQGCLISFDPNLRLELWDSPLRAHQAIVEGLRLARWAQIRRSVEWRPCKRTEWLRYHNRRPLLGGNVPQVAAAQRCAQHQVSGGLALSTPILNVFGAVAVCLHRAAREISNQQRQCSA